MTRFYFSGISAASYMELLAREGAAGMINARIATQPAMIAAYKRYPDVPLVLDSGAFQGVRDVEWYAEVVRHVSWRFEWCANLDVIGDQDASDKNWHVLQRLGADTLWVYQVQGGRPLVYLCSIVDELKFVGIGGLVPVIKSDVRQAVELVGEIGSVLAQAGAKAHFFGVSTPVILAQFGSESWFASADSQSWLCGFKARELLTRSNRRLKAERLGLELSRQECAAQNVRQILKWLSGEPLQFSLL